MLEGLAYLMNNPRDVPIVSCSNDICGKITVDIEPCNEHGNPLDESELTDEPNDLIGQELHFKMKIEKITNLP